MLIAALLYAALGGLYLLVIPAALLYYLKLRWNTVSSVERLILYALAFVFFPGMLLLSPLLNFRPQRREV